MKGLRITKIVKEIKFEEIFQEFLPRTDKIWQEDYTLGYHSMKFPDIS